MGPRLVVSNYPRLNVAPRSTRAGLVTVALAALLIALAFGAKLLGHPTETELGAADIQRTFGACSFGKLTAFVGPSVRKVMLGDGGMGVRTFCMCVTIAPAHVIGRLAIRSTGFWPVVAISSFLGAASAYIVLSPGYSRST